MKKFLGEGKLSSLRSDIEKMKKKKYIKKITKLIPPNADTYVSVNHKKLTSTKSFKNKHLKVGHNEYVASCITIALCADNHKVSEKRFKKIMNLLKKNNLINDYFYELGSKNLEIAIDFKHIDYRNFFGLPLAILTVKRKNINWS